MATASAATSSTRGGLRRDLLPEGHDGAALGGEGLRLGSLIVEAVVEVTAASGSGWSRRSEARRRPRGQAGRRARPLLQARDRRHARAPSVESQRARGQVARRSGPSTRWGIEQAKKLFCRHRLRRGRVLAVEGRDALVFMTEWNQFRALDMQRVNELMRAPASRPPQHLRAERMLQLGFDYTGRRK